MYDGIGIFISMKEQASTYHSRMVTNSPIFYGWIILFAGTFGMVMTSPAQTTIVSVFIEHFIEDFGISRTLISAMYTGGSLVGSLALPIIGRSIDRHGARVMVAVILGIFGIACVYMGYVQNAVMLAVGFAVLRMFGKGGLELVSQNVVNQWWVRRRGFMMGIFGMVSGLLGMGVFPNLANWLISSQGWRFTYLVFGTFLLCVVLPVCGLLFRDRPEIFGLRPDNDNNAVGDETADAQVGTLEENWTLKEALRTRAFWVFAIGLSLISLLGTGQFFHMISIFADKGLSPGVAAAVFAPVALTVAVVNLAGGVLVDRIEVRYLMALGLLFQVVSLLMALILRSPEMALLYGVVIGITGGLARTVTSVVWAKYFGRLELGSIAGVSSTVVVIGAALGPLPYGIARDLMGNYQGAFAVLAALPLLLAVGSLFVRRPVRAR